MLCGVRLCVEPRDAVLVSGRNGCGKTTLLNIAGCLDFPSRGDVLIAGHSVTGLKEKELSEVRLRKVGFVFQDHNLIEDLNIAQNVMLPLKLAGAERREDRTKNMLETFGLESLALRRPMELSTGQRQLAAIARALANGPSILLADEPSASLDEQNRSLVFRALEKANEVGAALIITCHNLESGFLHDGIRRFSMEEGKLQPA